MYKELENVLPIQCNTKVWRMYLHFFRGRHEKELEKSTVA